MSNNLPDMLLNFVPILSVT